MPDTELIQILGADGADIDQQSAKSAAKPPPEVLPILGLQDVVVFPGMVVPLLVEHPPSVRLIDDVVAGDRFLGLVLQRSAELEDPKPEDLHDHGCLVRVLKMVKFPDNSVRILIEGLRRFKISNFLSTEPYLTAKVIHKPEVLDSSKETAAVARKAHMQFQEIIALSPALTEQVKVNGLHTDQADKLSDTIAANLNLKLEERQELLANPKVRERLTSLLPLMRRELELLNLGSKIQNEVTTAMSKTQRDYFLREQIRALQRELGEADSPTSEIAALREQIEKASLPADVEKSSFKELARLEQIPVNSPEYTIARNYLDLILGLPWNKSTEDKIDLAAAEQLLDEQHFGLRKVKDRLLEFLAVIKLKNRLKGPILCLVGPPGVGKTSLGRSVADALGRKFVRISLGGMRDEAEMRGHRRTYIGAMPGRIIQSLRRVESNNPVILLDELDKIGSDFRGDPASALLEILDPQQNNTFTDNYLELPFDLSRVLFITTANWLEPVHAALRDRMEVIEIPSYTAAEKLHIARRHLLPRQLEEHGVKRKLIKLPDATLKVVISDYTREAGVRNLERELAGLVRKAARKIASGGPAQAPVTVLPKDLEDYLGPSRFKSEAAEPLNDHGIAIGLAWTPVGGEILFIEATRMPGKGGLILTGSLGDVMKESAQAALSYLRSQAPKLGLDMSDYDKHDIHLHVPAGATPKDGPSAGVTMTVALASLLTKKLVRSDTAMTGEISLRGRILAVGGIKEKVLAASRAGLKSVILPEDNRKDWQEVPADVRDKMKPFFVKHISQLLPLALVN